MFVLSGADLVLPQDVQPAGTLVIDGDRIVDVPGAGGAIGAGGAMGASIDLRGHIILPGFIDVHVHGIEGIDSLDGGDAIRAIAQRLVKYGVTAFCPTTVACPPDALRSMLQSVAHIRLDPAHHARVLSAHLESNFINPDYRGAQPLECLRNPRGALGLSRRSDMRASAKAGARGAAEAQHFEGSDILREIDAAGDAVGIVTLAPELDGALDLIRHLVSRGRRISLGHSGATLDQSRAAIDAGASQATHLFNRMPPLGHREPGLAGAVLTSEAISAEIICDGVHVQRDMVRMAIAAKGASRVMAITDAVAAAGLPDGSTASLGGRQIRVKDAAAYLDEGTLAGSIATMDRVLKFLVIDVGLSFPTAAQLCSATPAAELGLSDLGVIAKGAIADLVVIDREFNVKQTYIGGRLVYDARTPDSRF